MSTTLNGNTLTTNKLTVTKLLGVGSYLGLMDYRVIDATVDSRLPLPEIGKICFWYVEGGAPYPTLYTPDDSCVLEIFAVADTTSTVTGYNSSSYSNLVYIGHFDYSAPHSIGITAMNDDVLLIIFRTA